MKEETEDIQIGWSFLSEPGVDITVQPKAPGEVCPHAPIPRPACVCERVGVVTDLSWARTWARTWSHLAPLGIPKPTPPRGGGWAGTVLKHWRS